MTMDHVGVAVRNLAEAAALLEAALGLAVTERYDLPREGVRLAFLSAGGTDLELLEATTDTGPLARYLATRGPGLHHIAFRVPDIEQALRRASSAGCRPVDPAPRPGARNRRVAFLHPASTGGMLIELVEYPEGSAGSPGKPPP
jgi:methylmalonyl-CoA epimerase